MNEEVERAYKWAKSKHYGSVAATYAEILANELDKYISMPCKCIPPIVDENTHFMGHRLGDLAILADAFKKDGKEIENITNAIRYGYRMALENFEEAKREWLKKQGEQS